MRKNAPPVSPYLPIDGNAWRLAVGDVDGDGSNELICGLYQGAVSCVDPVTGRTRWRQPVGGFPFAVAAADVDGDGRAEVLAASADGGVRAFSGAGTHLWTYAPNRAPVYGMAVCRPGGGLPPMIVSAGMDRNVHLLSADGRLASRHGRTRAATHLAVGDIDGDGSDEVIVTCARTGLYEILRTSGCGLHGAETRELERVPKLVETLGEIVPFSVHSIDTGDLDGDGRAEIVLGSSFFTGLPVRVIAGTGETLFTTPRHRGMDTGSFRRIEYYSMSVARVAPPGAFAERPRVVVLTSGNVRILGDQGETVAEANAPVGFTDLAIDGRTLYLGSSPNGDRTVYRIDLGGDWVRGIESLGRHGLARRIGDTLALIRSQTTAFPATQIPPGHSYSIRAGYLAEEQGWISPQLDRLAREFPYPNFAFVGQSALSGMVSGLKENVAIDHAGNVVGKSPEGTSAEEFERHAAAFERSGRAFNYYISHGAEPRVTAETLDRMLAAAPSALRGFVTHEDEEPERLPGYCGNYLAALAERCVRRGKELVMVEKNTFWFDVPSDPAVGPSLFDGRTAPALVAGTDDANSRTPDLNLFCRVGLRQAGLVDRIEANAIGDLFCFNRMFEWEYPKHGHPHFRLLVAHTVLGASSYTVRSDQFHGDALTEQAREAFGTFFHLLGKGIVFTPQPEQMVGLSRLGFAVHRPPKSWIEDGHNGHRIDRWRDHPEADNAVLPRNACFWGISPTPPHALPAVLFGKTRQFGAHVPATPYGPVVFVPAHAVGRGVVGVDDWWHTDGVHVWREGGPKLNGEPAADALRASFEHAAARLPFRAFGDGLFFHSVKVGEGRYRIFVIDPGWLDPADRRCDVRIQLPGRFSAHDLLGDRPIRVEGGEFALDVPAGALRVIEVTAKD